MFFIFNVIMVKAGVLFWNARFFAGEFVARAISFFFAARRKFDFTKCKTADFLVLLWIKILSQKTRQS